jgi:hypothetical protein
MMLRECDITKSSLDPGLRIWNATVHWRLRLRGEADSAPSLVSGKYRAPKSIKTAERKISEPWRCRTALHVARGGAGTQMQNDEN